MSTMARAWTGRALGFGFGVVIWSLSPYLTGERELWDDGATLYLGSMFVMGILANLVSRESAWKTTLSIYLGQAVYLVFVLPSGPLTPIGLIFCLGYTLPAWLGAALVRGLDPQRRQGALLGLTVLFVGVLGTAGALLHGASGSDLGRSHIGSLAQWIELTQRPGFTLLDAGEHPDYYVSVYDTGRSEVALCYRWRHAGTGPSTLSFGVRDVDGRILHDRARAGDGTLLNEDGAGNDVYVDAFVIPIPDAYRGEIRLELKDNGGTPYPERLLYSKSLEAPWTNGSSD